MATISFDVPLTLVCARTRCCRAAKADTIGIAPLPLLLPERREVFPLMAMTAGAAPARPPTQAVKQWRKAARSSAAKRSPK